MRNSAAPWPFIIVFIAIASAAQAGPWLTAKGDSKLLYNHWTEDAPNRPLVTA